MVWIDASVAERAADAAMGKADASGPTTGTRTVSVSGKDTSLSGSV